jgi:hypothetical protein
VRERQPGADADLDNTLARPIVGDAHRLLPSRVKNRAEDDIVGAGKQPVGPDRIVQVHRLALLRDRKDRRDPPPRPRSRQPDPLVNLAVAFQGRQVILIICLDGRDRTEPAVRTRLATHSCIAPFSRRL